jgi:methyltransferase (TIGR00027 family)
VGVEAFIKMMNGEIELADEDPAFTPRRLAEGMAVRTRFFDAFFTEAAAAGVRQAVILAAGLDTRAYRLPWPPGTTVYEVDQPQVIEFKTETMAGLGAEPTAERRTVSIDLREDWPTALREHGFDDTKPSAWSAEGLLMYLPPEAQDRLFDHITALSAPGSRIATEYHPDNGLSMAERGKAMSDRWANIGCDVDLSGLFYEGDRNNVADYLTDSGWDVFARNRRDLFGEYGRVYPDHDEKLAAFRNIVSIIATRR